MEGTEAEDVITLFILNIKRVSRVSKEMKLENLSRKKK